MLIPFVLKFHSGKLCFCPQVVTPVVWNKPDVENSVPLWIIILAILAGLLLLALLIYVLYKVSELRLLPLKEQ